MRHGTIGQSAQQPLTSGLVQREKLGYTVCVMAQDNFNGMNWHVKHRCGVLDVGLHINQAIQRADHSLLTHVVHAVVLMTAIA